jgi:hypothetical protein
MHQNHFSQHFADFYPLIYLSMSAIFIASIVLSSSNVGLAKTFGPSVLPTCFTAMGTISSISGRQLQITPEQGGPIVYAEYSNATHFFKEQVVSSSALKEGTDVNVLAKEEAEVVLLDPSEQFSGTASLGCQMSQTIQRPLATPSSSSPSSGSFTVSQGTVQQITDNTFTISPHAGRLKTFAWAMNTTFLQYTDYQSSKILSLGVPVLVTGPIRNGVIIASRIIALPQVQRKNSFKQSCFLEPGNFVCDIISLGLLLLLV